MAEEAQTNFKPAFTLEQAVALAKLHFGVPACAASSLPSYDDQNFNIATGAPGRRTLSPPLVAHTRTCRSECGGDPAVCCAPPRQRATARTSCSNLQPSGPSAAASATPLPPVACARYPRAALLCGTALTSQCWHVFGEGTYLMWAGGLQSRQMENEAMQLIRDAGVGAPEPMPSVADGATIVELDDLGGDGAPPREPRAL